MQFIVISHQLLEMLWAFSLGMALGLLYEGVRFIRRLFSPFGGDIVLANVLDVLYLLFAGASYCIFLYCASNGRFRWFTATALFVGFLVYRLLPGRLIRPAVCFIADLIRRAVHFLVLPARMLIRLIARVVSLAFARIRRGFLIRRTERMKKQLCREVKL